LVSSSDAALRDLSAASLNEFVLWSIKQSTPQVKYEIFRISEHEDDDDVLPGHSQLPITVLLSG